MGQIKYFTVDVFTSQRFGGNQLAVVPDASEVPEDLLQKIAREFNFSETTFVYPPDKPQNVQQIYNIVTVEVAGEIIEVQSLRIISDSVFLQICPRGIDHPDSIVETGRETSRILKQAQTVRIDADRQRVVAVVINFVCYRVIRKHAAVEGPVRGADIGDVVRPYAQLRRVPADRKRRNDRLIDRIDDVDSPRCRGIISGADDVHKPGIIEHQHLRIEIGVNRIYGCP